MRFRGVRGSGVSAESADLAAGERSVPDLLNLTGCGDGPQRLI